MSLQLTRCMKVAATSYLLTLNEKKIIPQHLLCNREKEKYICSAFSPWCCSYKSYMSIKPVWGLTSFHLFFPSLLRHEEPPLPSLVCLFDMVGLEPVSGLVENKPCVFDLGFWMPQLFHSPNRLSQGSGFSLKHGKNVTLDRCWTTGFQLRNVAHPTCQPPTCSIFMWSSTEVDSTAHKLTETWENQEEPSASFKKGCCWTD